MREWTRGIWIKGVGACIGLAAFSPVVAAPLLRLAPAEQQKSGISLARAELAPALPLAAVPATILPPVGGRVAVAAPFPGVVREVFAVGGQRVAKGQRLAVVMSRDVLQMGANLARARAQLVVTRSASARSAALAEAGVIAGARAEEARASYAEARTTVGENARILAIAHGDPRTGLYTLVAPIAGKVSDTQIKVGAALDGMSAPFVIDATDRFALTAQLPERFAGQVRPGMRIQVAPGVEGTVRTAGSTVDPMTRSLMLTASVPSAPGLVAGQVLSATILAGSPAGAVDVPATALINQKGRWLVFVQEPGGFSPRVVQVAGRAAGRAVLSGGLRPGEVVAATGVTELASMSAGR